MNGSKEGNSFTPYLKLSEAPTSELYIARAGAAPYCHDPTLSEPEVAGSRDKITQPRYIYRPPHWGSRVENISFLYVHSEHKNE